ncbi:MAG: hypothetical protein IPJ03_07180 [Ignavibacteriales bacterium]|nr:hypothetical protein [Ignavibacteriales bacterium]
MKHYLFLILIIISGTLLSGCLQFKTVSYEVTMFTENSGEVIIQINDIRSDAETDEAFEEDKTALFETILGSQQFIDDMNNEGKFISSRDLFVENGKLNGKGVYRFDEIGKVEGMVYDDEFYYITFEPLDSIVSTNGQIFITDQYKRIVWDKSFKTLKFEMLSNAFELESYRELASFYPTKK